MKIAFTGHRPNKLGGYDDRFNFKSNFDLLVTKILANDFIHYFRNNNLIIISGMALGVDTWAAQLSIKYKIKLHAYIPFKGQEKAWPLSSQINYHYILKKAKRIKICCDGDYENWKMQERNKAMVNDSDILIAVWNGSQGGTANCVKYAQSINKKIIRINPIIKE